MSTAAYVDLLFAWGHARLGDRTTAAQLVIEASAALNANQPVPRFLGNLLRYRVEQALADEPHATPLPMHVAEQMPPQDADGFNYAVRRFSQHSTIAEAYRPPNLYAEFTNDTEGFSYDLAQMARSNDSSSISQLYQRCKSQIKPDTPAELLFQLRLLNSAADCGPIIGPILADTVSRETLAIVQLAFQHPTHFMLGCQTNEAIKFVENQFRLLLQRTLTLACRLWEPQFVYTLGNLVLDWVRFGNREASRYVGFCLPPLFSALYTFNHPDLQANLLDAISEEYPALASEPDLAAVFARAAWWVGIQDSGLLYLQQCYADWATFDPRKPLSSAHQLSAAVAIVGTGPVAQAQSHFGELLRRCPRMSNSFTTAEHYSRVHIQAAEAAILAMTTDDFRAPNLVRERFGPQECHERLAFLAEFRTAFATWASPGWNLVRR